MIVALIILRKITSLSDLPKPISRSEGWAEGMAPSQPGCCFCTLDYYYTCTSDVNAYIIHMHINLL